MEQSMFACYTCWLFDLVRRRLPRNQFAWMLVSLIGVALPSEAATIQVSAGGFVEIDGVSGDGSAFAFNQVQGDGYHVYGISQDGATTVGGAPAAYSLNGGPLQQLVNGVDAFAANANGTVIVGMDEKPDGATQSARWTTNGSAQELGILHGGSTSTAYGVSADGNTVVGSSGESDVPQNEEHAFVWTSQTGMQQLPDGSDGALAYGISGDGNVIFGATYETGSPVMWTRDPFIPNTWLENGLPLPNLPPGTSPPTRAAVSSNFDGSVIVGGETGPAFIWTSSMGSVDLKTYLESLGISDSAFDGGILGSAHISADGTTIAGRIDFAGGGVGYYIATVPEPSTGVLVLTGLMSAAAIVNFGRKRATHLR